MQKKFSKLFRCARFLYNKMLSDRKDCCEKISKILLRIQISISINKSFFS
ncbi:helix-turn-helix domain-containing protein (plasmid) [Borreliella californiensis]|uniref:Helix-turn-helix domain-containing protein n=1 Tax=Borreliella californiensis TaxID=373543 RepID=A0ABZ0CLF9_9SPIR|nr:helix-turn-helix domain-containing protein [Borreliella californiensis]WKC91266.1 helix-turn-helix domain-containing protein [Borreliella californiensis]WNY70925.1 helix-turn-helix domain-containing protein [Borreliella californiensis]